MTALMHTTVVDFCAAKKYLAELIERVEAGEEITIVRDGIAVAMIVPVRRATTFEDRQAAVDRILELSRSIGPGGLKIKDLIEEGRS